MTTTELTTVINTVLRAVAASELGPVLTHDCQGKVGINLLAKDTYLTLLSCVCPKAPLLTTTTIDNPKEPWQE